MNLNVSESAEKKCNDRNASHPFMNKCHIDGKVYQRNAGVTPKLYYEVRKLTFF